VGAPGDGFEVCDWVKEGLVVGWLLVGCHCGR
jgi:hypothetical protein